MSPQLDHLDDMQRIPVILQELGMIDFRAEKLALDLLAGELKHRVEALKEVMHYLSWDEGSAPDVTSKKLRQAADRQLILTALETEMGKEISLKDARLFVSEVGRSLEQFIR